MDATLPLTLTLIMHLQLPLKAEISFVNAINRITEYINYPVFPFSDLVYSELLDACALATLAFYFVVYFLLVVQGSLLLY